MILQYKKNSIDIINYTPSRIFCILVHKEVTKLNKSLSDNFKNNHNLRSPILEITRNLLNSHIYLFYFINYYINRKFYFVHDKNTF